MIRSFLKMTAIAAMLVAGSVAAKADGLFDNIGPKGAIGGLLGGALGGWGGSEICDGDCGKATTAGGAILGMVVGYGIGDSLDSIDRMRADQAAQRALNSNGTGRKIRWDNPNTGNSGSTVVNQRGYDTETGANCAEYTSTIKVRGQNKPQTAKGIACQNPDGTWSIQG